MSEVIHSRLCLTSAVRMAKENGAASLQEAIEWVRVWNGDGGLGNYGACTCELFGPEKFVIRFEDWAEAQLQLEELLELAEIRVAPAQRNRIAPPVPVRTVLEASLVCELLTVLDLAMPIENGLPAAPRFARSSAAVL